MPSRATANSLSAGILFGDSSWDAVFFNEFFSMLPLLEIGCGFSAIECKIMLDSDNKDVKYSKFRMRFG